MARKLDDIMATLPNERQQRVATRTMELITLKDLHRAVDVIEHLGANVASNSEPGNTAHKAQAAV